MKLSQFRSEKKIVFVDGKPTIKKEELNGEVNFYPINKRMVEKINEEVVSKFKGNEEEQEISYLMLPYLTDLEVDVDYETYKEIIDDNSNEAVIALFEGILGVIEEMFRVAEKKEDISNRNKKLEEKMPSLDKINKNELAVLFQRFAEETDVDKKNAIMDEIIKLKSEMGK